MVKKRAIPVQYGPKFDDDGWKDKTGDCWVKLPVAPSIRAMDCLVKSLTGQLEKHNGDERVEPVVLDGPTKSLRIRFSDEGPFTVESMIHSMKETLRLMHAFPNDETVKRVTITENNVLIFEVPTGVFTFV